LDLIADPFTLFWSVFIKSLQASPILYKTLINAGVILNCTKQQFIMASLILLLKFFGGMILLLLFGRLIGHLLKLDEFFGENPERHKKSVI
jgi:hypothetical protein